MLKVTREIEVMEKGNENKLKATAEALKKLDLKEFQYHKKTVEEVVAELKTNYQKALKACKTDQDAQKQIIAAKDAKKSTLGA